MRAVVVEAARLYLYGLIFLAALCALTAVLYAAQVAIERWWSHRRMWRQLRDLSDSSRTPRSHI